MQEMVEKALAMVVINDNLSHLCISGPTGVGKSFSARQFFNTYGVQARTLPVHLQEEALYGRLNLEKTLQSGAYHEEKGLLEQGKSLFFIDDMHLLRDVLRHQLLSTAHEYGHTYIGTISCEEGYLAPSEWEAIELHVAIENPSYDSRVEVLQNLGKEKEEGNRTFSLQEATACLFHMKVSDAMVALAVSYVAEAGTVGNVAETILLEAAKSIAALEGLSFLLPRHIEEASVYVLPHRMRKHTEKESSQERQQDFQEEEESSTEEDSMEQSLSEEEEMASPDNQEKTDSRESMEEYDSHDHTEGQASSHRPILPDTVAAIGQALLGMKLATTRAVDRHARKGSGKRLMTKTKEARGRYVRAISSEDALEDLALDATIRAAAVYQSSRKKKQKHSKLAVYIEKEDYRRKEREKRIGGYYLFVVDASGSMGAKKRMEAVKGAIYSLLQDAYEKRDKVGLIIFRKERAELVLPFTGSIDLAKKRLEELPTGGKTPLAAALSLAYDTCNTVLRRMPTEKIEILLVSDGRATYGEGENPVEEAKYWAKALRELAVDVMVIDTEQGFIRLGIAKEITKLVNGTYYSIDTISPDTVLQVAKGGAR